MKERKIFEEVSVKESINIDLWFLYLIRFQHDYSNGIWSLLLISRESTIDRQIIGTIEVIQVII